MRDPQIIAGYHAHIYYPTDDARARAGVIREAILERWEVRMGRWRDMPVGPHPIPMYQVAFDAALFPEIVPWLMLNRNGLTILVHPETGDAVEDHATNPLWLGQKLDLDIDSLRRNVAG